MSSMNIMLENYPQKKKKKKKKNVATQQLIQNTTAT